MSNGIEVQSARVTEEVSIPTDMHGFDVEVGIGPYPPNQTRSHRKAVYAVLRPNRDDTRAVMRRMGRDMILAQVPLTKDAAQKIVSDFNGRAAEQAIKSALKAARKLARQVERSA